jgi:hypothetical protein
MIVLKVEPFCGRKRGLAEWEPAGEILSGAKDLYPEQRVSREET